MRGFDRIADGLAVLAGLLILAMMLGVALDVAARFLFNRPLVWMFEAVQYSLLAVLFLGSPWVTRNNGHVAIDLLVRALPPRLQRQMQCGAFLIAGVSSGFLSYWAAVVAFDNLGRNVLTSGIYPVPRHYLIAVICIGLFLTAIEFIRLAVRAMRGEIAGGNQDPSSQTI